MRKNGERITELGGLLDALYVDGYGSRKTFAQVTIFRPAGECTMWEHFDSGAGHSSAFSSTTAPVDIAVFDEAMRRNYLVGRPYMGYTSTREFILTRNPHLLDEICAIAKEWQEKDYWKKRSAHEIAYGMGHGTYIRIIALPEGEAPVEVREAWVGLVLPASHVVGCGYSVPQTRALEILAERNQNAAAWWKEHGYPKSEEDENYFSFSTQEAEEFAGTFFHQKIMVIAEEA